MPYLSGDAKTLAEVIADMSREELPPVFVNPRPRDGFVYERASAPFTPEEFPESLPQVIEAVKAMGATAVRVTYDGGLDEGFAQVEHFMFPDRPHAPDEVASELATSLVRRLREPESRYAQYYHPSLSDLEAAKSAIHDMASALTMKIFGGGFGTGDYELYGALVADFKTGMIVDDPNVTHSNRK